MVEMIESNHLKDEMRAAYRQCVLEGIHEILIPVIHIVAIQYMVECIRHAMRIALDYAFNRVIINAVRVVVQLALVVAVTRVWRRVEMFAPVVQHYAILLVKLNARMLLDILVLKLEQKQLRSPLLVGIMEHMLKMRFLLQHILA